MDFMDGLDGVPPGGGLPFADTALCGCGSAWFRLEAFVVEGEKGVGAVALDGEGNITSYSGVFCCIECGERVVLPQVTGNVGELQKPHLRRVK